MHINLRVYCFLSSIYRQSHLAFVFVFVVKMFNSGSTWSAIMNGVTELPLEHAMAQWPCMTSGLENVR